MKRGTPDIRRTHARNYHHKESQSRLDETVKPFNSQVLNSLNVDYVPVQYYTIINSGLRCTCESVEIPVETQGIPVVSQQGGESFSTDETFEVFTRDKFGSMFGDTPANKEINDSEDPYAFDEEDVPVTNLNQIFAGGNAACGICYRTGYFNSYDLHRGTRLTLGTLNFHDVEGYNINQAATPNVFNRLHDEGYVLFQVNVPKYIREIRYSVRNNTEILVAANLYDSDIHILTTNHVLANTGKKIEIVVTEAQFTHVVLEFFTDIEPVRVNLDGINKTLDYTMLETMGNLSVIAPMTISTVSSGDVIASPSRNIFLRVVDVGYFQTATMRKLEWRLQCRVLQPTEALKRLWYNKRLA